MPRNLLDEERRDARLVVSLTRADKARLEGIAERAGLPVARVAREALLEGLGTVATRRRQTRHNRKKGATV